MFILSYSASRFGLLTLVDGGCHTGLHRLLETRYLCSHANHLAGIVWKAELTELPCFSEYSPEVPMGFLLQVVSLLTRQLKFPRDGDRSCELF